MSSISQLTAQQLRQAANLKDKITILQKQLTELVGANDGFFTSSESAKPMKKKFSAAGLAKIRAAQKARWAKVHAAQAGAASAAKPAAKRVMSAAGRARIAAAQKARWAKAKAGK
jgi:hypothetical protein